MGERWCCSICLLQQNIVFCILFQLCRGDEGLWLASINYLFATILICGISCTCGSSGQVGVCKHRWWQAQQQFSEGTSISFFIIIFQGRREWRDERLRKFAFEEYKLLNVFWQETTSNFVNTQIKFTWTIEKCTWTNCTNGSWPPPTTYGTDGHTVAGISPGAIQMFLLITSLRQESLKPLRIKFARAIQRHSYDDRKEQNKIITGPGSSSNTLQWLYSTSVQYKQAQWRLSVDRPVLACGLSSPYIRTLRKEFCGCGSWNSRTPPPPTAYCRTPLKPPLCCQPAQIFSPANFVSWSSLPTLPWSELLCSCRRIHISALEEGESVTVRGRYGVHYLCIMS
jgi:hypothetical protein